MVFRAQWPKSGPRIAVVQSVFFRLTHLRAALIHSCVDASLERNLVTKRFRIGALEALLRLAVIAGILVVASTLARQWAANHGVALESGIAFWMALGPILVLAAISLIAIAIAYLPALPLSWPDRPPVAPLPPAQKAQESTDNLERPPRDSATKGR